MGTRKQKLSRRTAKAARSKKPGARRASGLAPASKPKAHPVSNGVAHRKSGAVAEPTRSPPRGGTGATSANGAWPIFTVLGEGHGQKASPAKLGVEPETLLRMYRAMVLLRTLDARMLLLQRQGRIGFWGPTKGQEAATIGSCAAFGERDWILPALREAGAALYRGFPLREMVAQCLGNSGDKTLGRQMPCHYTFKAGNYVAMSSVIGTQIPHAVGVAMAAQIASRSRRAGGARRDEGLPVTAGYLGDGATSSTDFHAAMNFAAVMKSPVVLICQNNQWAISVPLCKQTATATIAQKALAYGMPAERVDGNDVLAVFLATRRAVLRAREGGGPTFLELLTYRVLGHSSSDDPTRYRDQAEVKHWEDRDPIDRCRSYLERVGLWSTAKEEELDGELNAQIGAAIREAEAMPPVGIDSLVEDVYADTPRQLRDQLDRARADLG